MSGTAVSDSVTQLLAAYEGVAGCDIGLLDRVELMSLMDDLEVVACQLPSQWQRMLARLQCETSPHALGAKTWNEVLRTRWRLSTHEAGRRLGDAAQLTPRAPITGPALPPVLPAIAAAQAGGLITPEHVKTLRDVMRSIPAWVDPTTCAQLEVDLVRVAVGHGPKELKETADLRLYLLDQDGPEPDDQERRRKRGVTLGRQGCDLMSTLTGDLDPEAAGVWEVLFAKFAAPGMCNPADDEPCTAGTPSQAQIDNDHRSLAQRQHDALLVVGRIALSSDLGKLNGLPVSVVIRTTLQDLEHRAGLATTGGGRKMPIDDVIRLASHASHHLCVFDGVTGSALAHYRGKRVATADQRIMLIARDAGCTKPNCTVGPYGCQAHHAVADWADGGNTNVDEMALACSGDNNMVAPDGWTTEMNDRHECEWTPPEHLDHGQPRINAYHRPEVLLRPSNDQHDDAVADHAAAGEAAITDGLGDGAHDGVLPNDVAPVCPRDFSGEPPPRPTRRVVTEAEWIAAFDVPETPRPASHITTEAEWIAAFDVPETPRPPHRVITEAEWCAAFDSPGPSDPPSQPGGPEPPEDQAA